MKDFETISIYTRAQAICDGVLNDVTDTAKKIGFKLNTVISEGLMREICLESKRTSKEVDVIVYFLLKTAHFKIVNSKEKKQDLITINLPWNQIRSYWSHVGPGDEGEAVLTFLFPEEY